MGAIADLLCVWVASVLGVDRQAEPAADLVRQLLLLVRVRAATQQQKHYCKLSVNTHKTTYKAWYEIYISVKH